jgi:hypothetical protein
MAVELMHSCTLRLPSFPADSLNKDGEHRKYSGKLRLTSDLGSDLGIFQIIGDRWAPFSIFYSGEQTQYLSFVIFRGP